MTRFFPRTLLVCSGAILCFIGSSIMLAPEIFLATSEVIVEHDASLMSEVTAPSGFLVIIGTFIILSAIKVHLVNSGLLWGALIYGSYGISRLISMDLHGIPSETLIVVTYFELAVAALLLTLRLAAYPAKWLKMLHLYLGQSQPSFSPNRKDK